MERPPVYVVPVSPRRSPHASRSPPTPQRVFLWLAPPFGLAFLVVTPPLQVPDENRHLNQAYMIATGAFGDERVRGGTAARIPASLAYLPARLGADLAFDRSLRLDAARWRAEFGVELAPERRVIAARPTRYSPVAYAPQALSIRALLAFEPPPVLLLYAARLANLAVWLSLLYAALRVAPSHGWVLMLLALCPMSLYLAASASVDAPNNALAFLLVALLLRLRCKPGALSSREGWSVWLVATLLGLCKQVYWLLALLVLLVPAQRFSSAARRAAFVAAVLLGSLLPGAAWLAYAIDMELPRRPLWSAPEAQLGRLQAEPLGFAASLASGIGTHAGSWLAQLVGVLGWLDTPLPGFCYVLFPLAALAASLLEPALPVALSARDRALLLGVAAGCGLAILLTATVAWTGVGHLPGASVQGRYLIPIAPLVLIALERSRAGGLPAWAGRGVALACALTLSAGLVAVVLRYHVAPS